MTKATFTIDKPLHAQPPESKVWFHVTVENGRVVALEEHDGYSGGPISVDSFSDRVAYRGGDQDRLCAFLNSMGVACTVDRSASMEQSTLDAIKSEIVTIIATTINEEARDAARWRALMSSDRIRIMGAAGFDYAEDGSVSVRVDGWKHMGLEVWDSHPAKGDESDIRGRAVLLAYVDHLIENAS